MCLSDFRRIAYMTKFNCISFTGARNQSQLLMAIVMFFLVSYAFGSLPLHSGRNNNVEIHAKRLLLKKKPASKPNPGYRGISKFTILNHDAAPIWCQCHILIEQSAVVGCYDQYHTA